MNPSPITRPQLFTYQILAGDLHINPCFVECFNIINLKGSLLQKGERGKDGKDTRKGSGDGGK